MKRMEWRDLCYDRKTMARNRKRFFAYHNVILYFLHSTLMIVLLMAGLHKWAIVSEGTLIGYALTVLLLPDVIAKEVADHPVYYGVFIMPMVYITLVMLLL